MGRRARGAGVHQGERPRRPAREVRPRARGGALPIAPGGADPRPLRRGDRRDHRAHGGTARVHGRRGGLHRHVGLARCERDRERTAVRGDASPRHRARAADRAGRGDRARARRGSARARGEDAMTRRTANFGLVPGAAP